MILSEDVKNKIIEEYNKWAPYQYGTLSPKEKKDKGAFYTPPEVIFEFFEQLEADDFKDKTILDPTCGSGNLLAACIIAGADPKKCFGNEFEAQIVDIARKRLGELGVPWWNIHQGDALDKDCITPSSFTKDYRYPKNKLEVIDLWNLGD